MIVQVPLNWIKQNPWNTRSDEPDPEYIKELALDIADNGLLQNPIGRFKKDQVIVDSVNELMACAGAEDLGGAWVELAFGHNRLAAFKWLNDVKENSSINGQWKDIAINVQVLTDEQMAAYAWSENEKRRDITPIDRAKAVKARMDSFGWTQEQAAGQLGLSRPTVANILRLLDLPEDLQQSVSTGEMSERAAIAILPVVTLPEDLLKAAEKSYYTPAKLINEAKEGASSDQIRAGMNNIVVNATYDLERAIWPLDYEFSYDRFPAMKKTTCAGCESKYLLKGKERCMVKECLDAREDSWRNVHLDNAADASGISILSSEGEKGKSFDYESDILIENIIARKCENLRLVYNQYFGAELPGYKNIRIVCVKNGQCKCLKEIKNNSPEAQEEKRREKEINKIIQAASQILVVEFTQLNPAALWLILRKLDSRFSEKGNDLSSEKILKAIADNVLAPNYWERSNLESTHKHIETIFGIAGLELPAVQEKQEKTEQDPLEERLDRITTWIDHLHLSETIPTIEQVKGNIDNLDKIKSEIERRYPNQIYDDHTIECLELVREYWMRLEDVLNVLQELGDLTINLDDLGWLLTVPTGDVNFQERINSANMTTLAYGLALISGMDGQGVRAGKLRGRLNVLMHERELANANA